MKQTVEDLVALCRTFGGFERDQVCCGDVTVQQCVTLQTLLDGPSEVSPLAKKVGNSASTMTRMINGLLKLGWVDRIRDEQDRRRVKVELTTSGKKEAERLQELTVLTVDSVLNQIPQKDRKQLQESLSILRKAMEKARKESGNCCRLDG